MTDEEKKGIISSAVEEVISKLKNEGTDIAATPTETNDENVGSVLIIGGDKELKQISKSNLIGKRITGRSADSNSITDPFKYLGNYEGSIQDLWDTLDDFTGDSTVGSEGYFRARNGNSLIEIVSYPISYKDNYWLQIVKGKLKVDDTGAIVSSTNFNILSRVHNYKGAGWSNWELIAGGDLVAAINNNIESLSDAITAEEIRAEGAEQALELSINSEITRAKAAEAAATEQGRKLALRDLYVAAGALYNGTGADISRTAPWGETVTHKAGHYYLNGLGDITEEQMKLIYDKKEAVYKLSYSRILQNTVSKNSVRTILPTNNATLGQILENNPFSGLFSVYGCKDLEVLQWGPNGYIDDTNTLIMLPASTAVWSSTFAKCPKLRIIHPINCANVTKFDAPFAECALLEIVRLFNIKRHVSFSDSPLLSKSSVLYTIQNALPSSAITITLHPDAYARLSTDADVVAALEAQPLVSLVCA